MMNKLLLLFTFSFVILTNINAQEPVVDFAAIEADVVYHEEQYTAIKKISEQETIMMVLQDSVKSTVEKIAAIEMQIYRGLTEVTTAITNAQSLAYAWTIMTKINEDVMTIDTMVIHHPELTLIGNRTKEALLDRLNGLKEYLIISVTGGRINLMNGVERTSLINHVLTELYIIQGMVYTIKRQMLSAIKQGWLHEVITEYFPLIDYYHRQNTQIANRIIENFHL